MIWRIFAPSGKTGIRPTPPRNATSPAKRRNIERRRMPSASEHLFTLNAIDLALATTREMLRVEPYDAEVAYTLRYMKDYLETAGRPDALKLAEDEHGKIVAALSNGAPLKATYGEAVVNTGLLYEMAVEAAFFERYAGNDAAGWQSYLRDVERALPPNAVLTGEDRQEIDSARLQYHLLGTRLEEISVIRSYKTATKKAPAITSLGADFGAATVLVVFPTGACSAGR